MGSSAIRAAASDISRATAQILDRDEVDGDEVEVEEEAEDGEEDAEVTTKDGDPITKEGPRTTEDLTRRKSGPPRSATTTIHSPVPRPTKPTTLPPRRHRWMSMLSSLYPLTSLTT